MRRLGNRGIILISSYLLLSLFLVYSNAMAVRTMSQTRVTDRFRDQLQATQLAQAAIEDMRENLFEFARADVYQFFTGSDAQRTLQWLDALGRAEENPPLDLVPINPDGTHGDGVPDGRSTAPRCITDLPLIHAGAVCRPTTATVDAPRAWIAGTANTGDVNGNGVLDAGEDPLAARDVTIEAEAKVGSVTKRFRATYRFQLGASDVFRYAYFINNHGWMTNNGSGQIIIYGDMRSNGDLVFTGPTTGTPPEMRYIRVLGDLYAAPNPERGDAGVITGDPLQYRILGGRSPFERYLSAKPYQARPTQRLVGPNEPHIGMGGGTPLPMLPAGRGWDSDYLNANGVPDQHFYPQQTPQDIPYVGDLTNPLSLYQRLATSYKGTGSRLTYTHVGADGVPGTADDVPNTTINAVSGSTAPLILVGTAARPIVIDGPVVIPGDVIIRGVIQGRGTIYAGRNVHVVGSVTYATGTGPSWPAIERDTQTGQLRQLNITSGPGSNLGIVCGDGTYVAPGGTPPVGC